MDDIHTTCKSFKHAMSKTVSGRIIHGPERNSGNLPEFGYLSGKGKGIVTKLQNSNTDRIKIVKNRAARDKVFAIITVF